MIGLLDGLSSNCLVNGRTLFKCPVAEELPGAFSDLLFDPADRYERLWSRALSGSEEIPFNEAASESADSLQSERRTPSARPSHFSEPRKPLHRLAETATASSGNMPQTSWKDVGWMEALAKTGRSRSGADAPHARAVQSSRVRHVPETLPLPSISSHSLLPQEPLETSLSRLLSVGAVKDSRASRPELSDGGPPIQIDAAPLRDKERRETSGDPKLGVAGENATSPASRSEVRTPVQNEPRAMGSPFRLAKSFAHIGQILGANLGREESGPSQPAESDQPRHRQPFSFPASRSPEARKADNLVPSFRGDDTRESTPATPPDANPEAIFEELEQRLKLEYLRMYGTSGGF